MDSLFCSCGSLYTIIIKDRKNINFCEICKKEVPFTNFIIDSVSKTTSMTNDHKKEVILYDDTYPLLRLQCKSCSNDIIAYYRNEKTMETLYICKKCKTYWN